MTQLKLWGFNQNRAINPHMPCMVIVVAPSAHEANRLAMQNDINFELIKDEENYYNWEPVEEADGIIDTMIINEIQTQRNKVEKEEANGHMHCWTIKYEERRTA
jgi:hypothetical protein